jgi:hypothetical protein
MPVSCLDSALCNKKRGTGTPGPFERTPWYGLVHKVKSSCFYLDVSSTVVYLARSRLLVATQIDTTHSILHSSN